MKALHFLLAALALSLSSAQVFDLNSSDDICRLFPDGTVLRQPGSCSVGIKCRNSVSTEFTTCTTLSAPYFSRTKQKCVAEDTDAYCTHPCAKITQLTFVADNKNCESWYACKNGEMVNFGDCTAGMLFNDKTAMCDYISPDQCKRTYGMCDVAPNNVKMLDEQNCNKYYECVKNKPTQKTCPAGQYFNVKTGACGPKAQRQCAKHPYPANVCGTKIPYRNRFVPDGATCGGYFYCKDPGADSRVPDARPNWGQCPDGLFFNAVEEVCTERTHVRCDEDRCEGRHNGLELSQRYGCQHYLDCKNNVTLAEHYCGDGFWFDAEIEACVPQVKTYPICK